MLDRDAELDELDRDIARIERELVSLERAPMERRWTRSQTDWMDACANKRQRIRVLRDARAALEQTA
jgi:hypothetical protein